MDTLTLDRSSDVTGVPSGDHQPEPIWEVVVPKAVDGLWHLIAPLIKSSMDWSPTAQKLESVDDIRMRILAGDYALWICVIGSAISAALVIRLTPHPRCRVVDIHYGAGKSMFQWLPGFSEMMLAEARAAGCRFVRIQGRKEWASTLKKLGFVKTADVFTMEI